MESFKDSKTPRTGEIYLYIEKANSMKNSASLEELKTFCTNILRYSLNNSE